VLAEHSGAGLHLRQNIRKLAGLFTAGEVLAAHRDELWDQVAGRGDVDWDGYAACFDGAEVGYAIEVASPAVSSRSRSAFAVR
jgi:predicted transcriptional regulator